MQFYDTPAESYLPDVVPEIAACMDLPIGPDITEGPQQLPAVILRMAGFPNSCLPVPTLEPTPATAPKAAECETRHLS